MDTDRLRALASRLRAPLASLALLLACSHGASAGVLPYSPALSRVYDAILDARFDDAENEVSRACPPAPQETCELMRAIALWWRIQLNPTDKTLDPQFRSKIDPVLASLEQWVAREPKRADAWFFLGAGYGLRVQFRVLRYERLAAARDGKRIKDALERCLALDPGLQDAYFGIGLYHYYADIAPAALKLLRWMLFLPGGNRAQGLREMVRARDRGELLRGEADFQLHLIYIWYEQNPDEALRLLEGLHARYPHNPLFLQSIAEVQETYRHDHPASLDAWRALFTLAQKDRVSLPEMSEARARLGIAAEENALFETDYAIEGLRQLLDAKPSAPYGIRALAELRLGTALDRMGLRTEAVAAYRAAIAAAPSDDPDGVRPKAAEGLRRQPDPRAAEAYRLSIDGLRHLQRGDLARARESLDRAAALAPSDPVTAFRVASLLLAERRSDQALAAFEKILATRPIPPPTVLGPSCLGAARLLEASSQRDRAIELYRRATQIRGVEASTRQTAQKALERLNGRGARHSR